MYYNHSIICKKKFFFLEYEIHLSEFKYGNRLTHYCIYRNGKYFNGWYGPHWFKKFPTHSEIAVQYMIKILRPLLKSVRFYSSPRRVLDKIVWKLYKEKKFMQTKLYKALYNNQ